LVLDLFHEVIQQVFVMLCILHACQLSQYPAANTTDCVWLFWSLPFLQDRAHGEIAVLSGARYALLGGRQGLKAAIDNT